MKKIPLTASDGVKEVTMGMKNNEVAGTDDLLAECFRYRVNEKKYQNNGNCDRSVRGKRKAIKMEERDYLSVVWERRENVLYRFYGGEFIYCCLLNTVQSLAYWTCTVGLYSFLHFRAV